MKTTAVTTSTFGTAPRVSPPVAFVPSLCQPNGKGKKCAVMELILTGCDATHL